MATKKKAPAKKTEATGNVETCPSNSVIKNTLQEIIAERKEVTMAELKQEVVSKLELTEAALKEKTESGNGNRFQIRFSAGLHTLVQKGLANKENNVVTAAQ